MKRYSIQGDTCYYHGEAMRLYPAQSSIYRLRARGVREIVWSNGDFIDISSITISEAQRECDRNHWKY